MSGPLKYGLPLRPPTASTALWAHILKQDTQPSASLSDTSIVVPPTVPLDKNATSMRVLLHDTQANFEKFAIHVGKLIDGVIETKHEIKTINDLFERDRQRLVGDIIDLGMFISLSVDDLSRAYIVLEMNVKTFSFSLVNRSQKEIQKSVGSPCQTASTETYFKDVNHRLDTLDQRLDAIQAVITFTLNLTLTFFLKFSHSSTRHTLRLFRPRSKPFKSYWTNKEQSCLPSYLCYHFFRRSRYILKLQEMP